MEPNTENASKQWLPRVLIGLGIAAVTIPAAVVTYQLVTWPDVESLARQNPRSTAFIERFLEVEGGSASLSWMWTDWEDISPAVKAAVLVAEDIEFFGHDGFSRSEMKAAFEDAIKTGDLRGASTLTQQLAKNLWLSPSRNPLRKVKEAILTMQIEKYLSKERIFELYLNVAQFGNGVYGVEAASRTYFAKTANRLSRGEGAMLAASLTRPSTWNPSRITAAYRARAGRIEDLMNLHGDFLERRVGLPWYGGGSATLETSTTPNTPPDDGRLASNQTRR
jgi:monofunctional biosynthetic peptidoglycan transglycosylase